MGIRGLFTYIENYADRALEWHKLHNCNLIVDGNNLAYDLYHHCKGKNVAFGGDYDKFSSATEDFFKRLLQCNVQPYVIIDGGYPLNRKKFRTVQERISKQLDTCNRVNPDNQSTKPIFPLMGRSVFVNVIQKLGITVLQCDFEADDEIVVIAKRLNAFVLSNDSDFYLFDIPFILLNSVNMKCLQKEVVSATETIKFIPCYVFNAEIFAEITKVSNSLLPILAPILGNDFLRPKFLNEFYSHISALRPRSARISERHKTIMCVFRWLSTQPSEPKEVLKKIINMFHDELPKQKIAALKETMQTYFPNGSNLEPWVEKHSSTCILSKEKKVVYYTEYTSKINFSSKYFIPTNVEKLLKCSCDDRLQTSMVHGSLLPGWFIKAYRLHLVPPLVANLLNKNYFFTMPQIEFQERKSVYLRLECIVRGVRGLLWSSLERSLKIKEQLEKPQTYRGLLNYQLNSNHCKYSQSDKRKHQCDDVNIVFDGSSSSECSDDQDNEETEYENLNTNFQICDLLEPNKMNVDLTTQISIQSDVKCSSNDDETIVKEKADEDQEEEAENGDEDEEEEEEEEEDEEQELSEDVNVKTFKEKRKIPFVRWYIRNFSSLSAKKLFPERIEKYKNIPTLFDMEQLSIKERKKHFFKICQMKFEFDEELPKNVEFILVIICYWYKKYSGHIHRSSVLSVLMCVLMFCFIDGKCGRKRSKKGFEKVSEYSKKIKLINCDSAKSEWSSMKIMNLLKTLSKEECLLANLSLFQFHDTDPRDSRKNYDRCAVHCFSEYQACFYFLSTLNSLLCFPFPSISVESYWSGTFCYNVRKCFLINDNVSTVLNSIFGNNIRIIHLFTRLYSIVQKQLGLPIYEEHIIDGPKQKKEKVHIQNKKKLGLKSASQLGISTKRKKFSKTSDSLPVEETNFVESATEEEMTLLVGNRFSKLLTL